MSKAEAKYSTFKELQEAIKNGQKAVSWWDKEEIYVSDPDSEEVLFRQDEADFIIETLRSIGVDANQN